MVAYGRWSLTRSSRYKRELTVVISYLITQEILLVFRRTYCFGYLRSILSSEGIQKRQIVPTLKCLSLFQNDWRSGRIPASIPGVRSLRKGLGKSSRARVCIGAGARLLFLFFQNTNWLLKRRINLRRARMLKWRSKYMARKETSEGKAEGRFQAALNKAGRFQGEQGWGGGSKGFQSRGV